jgi:DNA (cytosine-5)-methyltransferase 1
MVVSSKNDRRIMKIRDIIAEGGYQVTTVLLNASDFGVPQKRRRVFFLITKAGVDEQIFLSGLHPFKKGVVGAAEILGDLPTAKERPDKYDAEKEKREPYNHFAMIHSQSVKDKIANIPPGTGPMSYRRLHPTKPSNTLFSGHRAPPAHYSESRSITVREAARLQGFPDSFRIYGPFASQMEQVTNAVPPPLAGSVFRALMNHLS